jgi:hypothetical protein
MDLSGQWIDRAHHHCKLTKLILDMDSSVSETYGHQQGRATASRISLLPQPAWQETVAGRELVGKAGHRSRRQSA